MFLRVALWIDVVVCHIECVQARKLQRAVAIVDAELCERLAGLCTGSPVVSQGGVNVERRLDSHLVKPVECVVVPHPNLGFGLSPSDGPVDCALHVASDIELAELQRLAYLVVAHAVGDLRGMSPCVMEDFHKLKFVSVTV